MIIDDEPDILLLYGDYLLAQGHTVVTFISANNITVDYESARPDIVLMDYLLPGKNGLNAAMEIFVKYPLAPILFITAYEKLNEEISKYHIFGNKIIQVLIKPVRLAEIESAMHSLVYEGINKFVVTK
jgi:DNA-binding response OmpR family regulator